MAYAVEINFRNTERSEAVETVARERAMELPRAYDRLMHCRVVIEKLGRSRELDVK